MVSVTNTTEQTLAVGQSITFDNIALITKNCSESFRNGSSAIRTGVGMFEVTFGGNIGGTTAAAPVQLSISVDGAPLIGTNMISTPAAVGDLNSVARVAQFINDPCIDGGSNVTVTNTGANPVVVGVGAKLSVRRVG